ncbi:MAG: HNH/ENDO VII family nuclease, partial [Endozoicomonas sp.]|uniref:HNH/ENDO VII family nuclease n=1 Tax=Endozoicomonas sp. TaxID=1892382 RepID=UPI003D9BC90E
AQHSLEISELAGSAAFEILLTLVLAAVPAGTGAIVNLASKARLARQMTDLGESLKELADLKKVVQQHSEKKTLRTQTTGDMTKDLPVDNRPPPQNNPPPRGESITEVVQGLTNLNRVNGDKSQHDNRTETEVNTSNTVDDKVPDDFSDSKYSPVEVNGRKVYKNAVDVNLGAPLMVHRSVHKSIRQKVQDEGWTNLDLMENGYAPIGPDGKQINLHHILGQEPGPMVELTSTLHKKHHKPLHGLIEDGRSFRNDPSIHYQYEKFRKEYWKHRAEDFK